MDDTRLLPIAAGLGAIAGLRTFSAPLALSRAARENALDLEGTPLAVLGTANGAHTVAALALGECIADKTPWIPNRTDTPALIGRAISGAIAGAAIGKARNGRWIASALVGAAAAIGAAFAGYHIRRRAAEVTGIPDITIALVEDAVVIGSGLALIEALKSA